jgi:peroxiredoxin
MELPGIASGVCVFSTRQYRQRIHNLQILQIQYSIIKDDAVLARVPASSKTHG